MIRGRYSLALSLFIASRLDQECNAAHGDRKQKGICQDCFAERQDSQNQKGWDQDQDKDQWILVLQPNPCLERWFSPR